jgi:hypothetical protein
MRMTNKVYIDVPLREFCSQSSYLQIALYFVTSIHMTFGGTLYVHPPLLEQQPSFTGLRTMNLSFSKLQVLELSLGQR